MLGMGVFTSTSHFVRAGSKSQTDECCEIAYLKWSGPHRQGCSTLIESYDRGCVNRVEMPIALSKHARFHRASYYCNFSKGFDGQGQLHQHNLAQLLRLGIRIIQLSVDQKCGYLAAVQRYWELLEGPQSSHQDQE